LGDYLEGEGTNSLLGGKPLKILVVELLLEVAKKAWKRSTKKKGEEGAAGKVLENTGDRRKLGI